MTDIETPSIVDGSAAGAGSVTVTAPAVQQTKRSVDEWIGKTPDSAIPSYVKQRILERYGWKCYLTGIDLRHGAPFDFDHIVALCNGGEHRESNLAPVWRPKHREKTAVDVSTRAATDRLIAHNYGLEAPKKKIGNRPKKPRIETRPALPRRPLYVDKDERTAS